MIFSLHKANCRLCFKSFVVPINGVKNNFTFLYYNREVNSFSFFNWNEDSEIKKIVSDIIEHNENIQILNDNSKGVTVGEIIALMAGEKWELVNDIYRCPRCKYRSTKVSNEERRTINLNSLTFNRFLSNQKIELDNLIEFFK